MNAFEQGSIFLCKFDFFSKGGAKVRLYSPAFEGAYFLLLFKAYLILTYSVGNSNETDRATSYQRTMYI